MSDPVVAGALVHLFDAAVRFTSESPDDAVVSPDGREGVYLGSGEGVVTGERLRGRLRWSFYSGNCLYPQIRRGAAVPDGLNLCTLNPGGCIESDDGARIAFDGKGLGLRSPDRYRVSMTMAFRTEDARYAWLNRVLGVMTGDFDENTGRADWRVYVPDHKTAARERAHGYSVMAIDFTWNRFREEQMKIGLISASGLALILVTLVGATIVVAQDQASKSKTEQKAPEVFCDGLSTGQLCLSNAPTMLKLTDAQKQRWTEAARQYNKAIDGATKQFLEQSKPILSPEQFANMQKWFEMGLNPVLNEVLSSKSRIK